MTLPNKLTILRLLMIPLMVIIYYIDYFYNFKIFGITLTYFLMNIIFIMASFTDFLDGYLARKNNLVTTFGKFADPLADKILVITALILLLDKNVFQSWILIIIIFREFMVSGIRLVAVENNNVIAASKLGKIKTFTTMFAVIFLLCFEINILKIIGLILLYIALFFTVLSGIDYAVKNIKTITKTI